MTTQRTYHVQAVTLHRTPFSERDRLLVLYTRHHGKVRALAKGVRRTTSKLAGHVELFTHSTLFLAHGRTFEHVTQGQTIERFALLYQDQWRYSLASWAGELAMGFTEEAIVNAGLFDALLLGLRRLSTPEFDPLVSLRAFELDLLGLSGYRPQLHRCIRCDTPIEPAANTFSSADGGVLCPVCSAGAPAALPISVEALRILRNLQTRAEAIVGRVRVSPSTIEEAERVLIGYIQYLLDRRIKSVACIDVLRRLQQTQERSAALG